MSDFATWLIGLFKALFSAIWDLISDAFIAIVGLLLDLISYVINHIPVPDFLTSSSLGVMFSGIDPSILYFAQYFKLTECFALIASAVAFRLLRKFLTLFQW